MTRCFLLLLGGLLIGAQAQAQTMYRCGSVYQDRPCDAGKKGKAVGSTGTGAAAPQAGGADAECVQRGRDSNKVIWAREGGATQERLLSEAKTGNERRLIQDVYRRPGAPSTVQAAVEADCMAEKQQEALDLAVGMAAALKAQREGKMGAPAAPSAQGVAPDPQAQERAAQRAQQQQADNDADKKRKQCAAYNEWMERLRTEERAGGSAQTMDRLNADRRNLRERMSKAGC